MARRVIDWFANVVHELYAEPEPHFHQGPESTPAVCYDPRCGSPQLDIGTK